MRLFISYARVDKSTCQQLLQALGDAHEVWYDRRLLAGMEWWPEIEYRLHWCDGLIYVLSPESVASEYCIREYELARRLGKRIFPVLIQSNTRIPAELGIYQYADISADSSRVTDLLNALTVAERSLLQKKEESFSEPAAVRPLENTSHLRIGQKISLATQAIHQKNYEVAFNILQEIKESGSSPRYVSHIIDQLFNEARNALERTRYGQEVAYEYDAIVALVMNPHTSQQGCNAFLEFQKEYPYYDPETVAPICQQIALAMPQQNLLASFNWYPILSGQTTLADTRHFPLPGDLCDAHHVEAFQTTRHTVKAGHFKKFLHAEDGYSNLEWWNYSRTAYDWTQKRRDYTELEAIDTMDDEMPATGVTWYDAVAFSNWLSSRVNLPIRLPTDYEYQRMLDVISTPSTETAMTYSYETVMTPTSFSTSTPTIPMTSNHTWEWSLSQWQNHSIEKQSNRHRSIRRLTAQAIDCFYHQPDASLPNVGFRLVTNAL